MAELCPAQDQPGPAQASRDKTTPSLYLRRPVPARPALGRKTVPGLALATCRLGWDGSSQVGTGEEKLWLSRSQAARGSAGPAPCGEQLSCHFFSLVLTWPGPS